MSSLTPLPASIPPASIVDAYLRDSGGPRQDKSTTQQHNEVRAYCITHGLILRDTYIDAARSGKTTAGREEFQRMLSHYKTPTNRPVALLLWNYARFARDIDDSQLYKITLRHQWKIIIHSMTDSIPEGKYGKLVELMIDVSNEEKREQASIESKRGLRDLVQRFGCVPGVPPTGFRRVPVDLGDRRDKSKHIAHRWKPDPEFIPRIRQAFEMRAAGATLSQIQKNTSLFNSLNSYTTFFRNPIYIGVLKFSDLTIENYCDPIVDRKTWDAVQRIVERNAAHRNLKQSQHHPTRHIDTYLLSGIATCARCNSVLVGMTSGQRSGNYYYRYACSKAKRGGTCDLTPVPARPIENAVIDQIDNFLSDPANIRDMLDQQRLEDKDLAVQQKGQIAITQKKLTTLRRSIANITAAIRTHGHSKALLKELSALEANETELETRLLEIRSQSPEPTPDLTQDQLIRYSNTIHKLIRSKNHAEIRTLLKLITLNVSVNRDKTHTRITINFRAFRPRSPRSPKTGENDDDSFDIIAPSHNTAYLSHTPVGAPSLIRSIIVQVPILHPGRPKKTSS
jgi:site-specific DNA recombinase